jgi:hypothetical protein
MRLEQHMLCGMRAARVQEKGVMRQHMQREANKKTHRAVHWFEVVTPDCV